MTRTPWYNARTQPPVNGGPGDYYEWICKQPFLGGQMRLTKDHIMKLGVGCQHCQWRGLTKKVSK